MGRILPTLRPVTLFLSPKAQFPSLVAVSVCRNIGAYLWDLKVEVQIFGNLSNEVPSSLGIERLTDKIHHDPTSPDPGT